MQPSSINCCCCAAGIDSVLDCIRVEAEENFKVQPCTHRLQCSINPLPAGCKRGQEPRAGWLVGWRHTYQPSSRGEAFNCSPVQHIHAQTDRQTVADNAQCAYASHLSSCWIVRKSACGLGTTMEHVGSKLEAQWLRTPQKRGPNANGVLRARPR